MSGAVTTISPGARAGQYQKHDPVDGSSSSSPGEREGDTEGGGEMPLVPHSPDLEQHDDQAQRRPEVPRAATEPTPAALLHKFFERHPLQPVSSRTRSPYSRSHLRSRSSGAALAAPPMARAHSLPSVSTSRYAFDSSPLYGSLSSSPGLPSPSRTPAQLKSPFRSADDNAYSYPAPRLPVYGYDGAAALGASAIESIQEDSELELAPRQPLLPQLVAPHRPSTASRRRPVSPLHSLQAGAIGHTAYSNTVVEQHSHSASGGSSPALNPQKYNEAYPSLHHYSSTSSFSSIPSTPTSARSRSPSISSLETIEDAPDLESEAVEEERTQRLKLAAERAARGEDDGEDEPRRRRSLDTPRVGFGFARGGIGRERKRWSVCGAERRADLDLETIWED